MTVRLEKSQFQLLSRYCEDISKAILLYNVAGYFFPSVLSSAFRPTGNELIAGILISLTFLLIALTLDRKTTKIK